MRRSRKIILISLLAVVVLAGSIGGIALAQTDEDDSPSEARCGAFLEKVCDYYNGIANQDPDDDVEPINCDTLKEAFAEAGNQLRDEARERFHQRLLDEGITQEQIEQFKEWMEARPDFQSEEFKAWLEAKPDVPFPFGPKNRGGLKPFGGPGGGFRGFGGPCLPPTE
jgi:hypothetical protein